MQTIEFTRLLPSDWDEDEEYIFDDSYNIDDDDEDKNDEDNVDEFDDVAVSYTHLTLPTILLV